MSDRTVLWVGTRKGLYGFESDADRRAWRGLKPLLPEWEIDAILTDPDDPDHLLVGTSHMAWGPTLRETRDGGASWDETPLRAAEDEAGYPVNRVWQLVRSPDGETLFAGVDEAALFRSDDDGKTWAEVETLTAHPSRPHWNPGAGGLCLHTILIDPANPDRMWVAISAVGVFGTTDGGETWTPLNHGLPAMVMTGSEDEDAAYCVHKIVHDPADPDRLFMQFHAHDFTPDKTMSSGVFRSDDAGGTWKAIDEGFPHRFGFPVALSKKGELFVMPVVVDNRAFEDGVPRVWRSRDAGGSWETLDVRPIDEPVYHGVLRDAMVVDDLDPTGVYLATTGGEAFASADAGESWRRMPARLPRSLCVRVQPY